MNKKGLIVLIFGIVFVLFLASFAFAAENTTNIDDAYKCLRNQTAGKNLSLKEATFSLLALGGQENFNKVESLKDVNSCWPKGACTLKETAQALLAYKGVGQDTTGIKNWILSKNTTANELKWILEIDISNKVRSVCTINDGQRKSTITILADSTITGTPGPCFTLDQGSYMLKVAPNCLRNEFEISCDQDFVTSVLYQKATGGTLFILPEAHSAASLGSAKEKINGECLRTGTGGLCDYEGTLWAALALQKLEVDVSRFTPYLLALADDNTRYFPSAFLYILVGGDDQYNLIIEQQKQGRSWQITGSRETSYYDTSLAMLSLADKTEIDATKEYLLSIQMEDGCWENNNIRDTAFILYSGWPRTVTSIGAVSSAPCESPYSCENLIACTNAGGTTLALECPNAVQFCCTTSVGEETCSEKNGVLCSAGQDCTGGTFESSAESYCCVGGTCEDVLQVEDTCTPNGGTCKATCDTNEELSVETCSITGESCCAAKPSSSFWIVLLIILVVLAALGIIFRNKLKMWWYKIAERFRKKPTAQQPARPMMPGQQLGPYPRQMMQQRPMTQPAMQARPIRPVAKDKEMEEALKKLREMAKR